MKTTAAAARRLPPAPGAARVPEPAMAPAAGSALPTPPAPHLGRGGTGREGGVWKRTYPAAAGHRSATRAAHRTPRAPPSPAASPLAPAVPCRAGSCRCPARGAAGGAAWRWGQRVAGPYLQGSPWPAAGRSVCPPGAIPAPSIPSPAPHARCYSDRLPPHRWSRAVEGVREPLSDGGCAGNPERWRVCRRPSETEGVQQILSDGGCAGISLASPSDGGCAGASFILAERWRMCRSLLWPCCPVGQGQGAFSQPHVGTQPLHPSARQLPDPQLPPLPHRRAAGFVADSSQ